MNSYPRRDERVGHQKPSSQEARQEYDRSAPPIHHSGYNDPNVARTSAEKAALAHHRRSEQQLSALSSYTTQGGDHASSEALRYRPSAENKLLRGVGAHLDQDPPVAQVDQTNQYADQLTANTKSNEAGAYADRGGHHAAFDHNPGQGHDLRRLDPMDRYLLERPSDQSALFVDPATGRLSYGGGYLRRSEDGDK